MSPVINKQPSQESDEIDFGRLIGELIDHRKLIISVTSLFTLIALIYSIFSTKIKLIKYHSKSTLISYNI